MPWISSTSSSPTTWSKRIHDPSSNQATRACHNGLETIFSGLKAWTCSKSVLRFHCLDALNLFYTGCCGANIFYDGCLEWSKSSILYGNHSALDCRNPWDDILRTQNSPYRIPSAIWRSWWRVPRNGSLTSSGQGWNYCQGMMSNRFYPTSLILVLTRLGISRWTMRQIIRPWWRPSNESLMIVISPLMQWIAESCALLTS